MSNEFQATLLSNKVKDNIKPVYYGSTIKIKNEDRKSFLHSHKHTYPLKYPDGKISSQGQQVTGYHHPDQHNDWIILPAIVDPPIDYINNTRIPVKNGDRIRLYHPATKKYLLTHDVASPLTTTNQEVTAVKAENATSKRYHETLWRVKITKGGKKLMGKTSLFELEHDATGCTLLTSNDKLPDWAYQQLEVNAGRTSGPNTLWSVDSCTPSDGWKASDEPKTEDQKTVKDGMGFFRKFIELLRVSIQQNAKLSDSSPYNTHPIKW
eukprot:CAMPEP_0176460554 /NCGR_PEP_ID=MMETSP0127-20121128/34052_1 /TAXON_ID=938130 /ORGANISM="Platyophrya macrostoma, Strain WH" /LENGTH=265 /DNA_ID=CAMNT_0017851925 /DNA_START=297 /DNA_END=1091 /DNA_ORIENTATION=-